MVESQSLCARIMPGALWVGVALTGALIVGCDASSNDSGTSTTDTPAVETSAGGTDARQAADEGDSDAVAQDGVVQTGQSAGEDAQVRGHDAASGSQTPAEIRSTLDITEDFRDIFIHGEKPAEFQKYIVMHDTEGEGEAANVIDLWASNGDLVAAHFVVNKDGSIVQCVPLDKIAHHAGFGDAGHNELFGVTDESRDDKEGTRPIGDWAPDYGMNSYSVGIGMVHVGESGESYPEEQLRAVDGLIAYIDAYYGSRSEIIGHNDWRTGSSDCSEEFQPYLRNLQTTRTHDGS